MKKTLAILGLLFGSNLAHATIYDFTWNSGWQDILTGYVDTQRDALFVTSVTAWQPGLNHSINPLVPDLANHSVFPTGEWELDAVDLTGAHYDLSDNWDGVLGGSWGFASNIAVSEIPYLNGSVSASPYYKFYTSIGLNKIYFNLVNFYSYSPTGESYLLADGSLYSQLSDLAANYANPANSLNDFPTEFSFLSAGGSHRISQRHTSVSEPTPFVLIAISLLGIALRRSRFWN